MQAVLLKAIAGYRKWISPALPGSCRFHPSCSAYAAQALETHGVLKGGGLTFMRLARCHPLHPGGVDPVPPPADRSAQQICEEHHG